MPRFHTKGILNADGMQIGQENIQFTTDEETAANSAEATIAAAQPLKNWMAAMSDTDRDVPRSTEDIYDALQEDAQARVPQVMRDRITAKKTLRGQKP
jgi:hypothetical protein